MKKLVLFADLTEQTPAELEDGAWWLAESEIADVCTQGRSRKDAARMLVDAFETLIDRPGCKVTVTDGGHARR